MISISLTLVVFYTYVLFPILLSVIVRRRAKHLPKVQVGNVPSEALPPCTLLITGHNIQHLVAPKIDNLSELHYPGSLKVMFVLDGCTDGTKEAVAACIHGKALPFDVNVIEVAERHGKEHAIRTALKFVETDIMAFSDSDAQLDKECLYHLVRRLEADPKCGVVCGKEIHRKNSTTNASEGQSLFYKYEEFVKERAAKITSLPYIQGGNFAMRKSLYPSDIPPGATQDGIIAFDTVLQDHYVAYEQAAISYEDYLLSNRQDFSRRIRTISRAFYAIVRRANILNPFKHGWFAMVVISSRLLRWLTAYFLAIAAFFAAVAENSALQDLIFGCYVLFCVLAILGALFESINLRIRALYVPYYFSYIHIAAAIAIAKVIFGHRTVQWRPSSS